MEARRDIFQAIADPTRREIINLIARNPQNLNAIANNFRVTRQAISLHIKILTECGLIEIRQQGRERFCEAKLERLNEVHAWTEQYRALWTQKFRSLKSFLRRETAVAGKSKNEIKSIPGKEAAVAGRSKKKTKSTKHSTYVKRKKKGI